MDVPRQPEADQASITFRVGDLRVETGRQRVTRDDVPLTLPKLTYDLLLVLIRASPNLVSNEELLDKVWPKSVVSPETLSQRVKLLRDALGDNPRTPTYIEGLRGRGYRLIPEVEHVANALTTSVVREDAVPAAVVSLPARNAEPVEAVGADAALPSGAPGVKAPNRVAWIAGLGVFGLVALLTGILLSGRHASAPKSSVDVVAIQPRAIAVLPFENLSEAPGTQYIALGIAESVLNRLGSVRELIVIARSSSFSLSTPRPDAREVSRKLGVQYLVQGSVQRAGDKLRVNSQLVDAVSNREIWSLSFDRRLEDVFAMQDEIAVRVAEKLEVSLGKASSEYAAFGTEAYMAFLHGRALMELRKIPDLEASIAEFGRALKLAPSFAAAMTSLAEAKLSLSSIRNDFNKNRSALLPELQSLVDRAIALDPGAGAPYFMRAQLAIAADPGHVQAEADFRKGLELAPNDAYGVYNYGSFLWELGRMEEALSLLERASLLDPMAASTHYLRGQILYSGFGRLDEAAASYRQALAVAPDFYPAHTRLAMVYFQQGRLAEAIPIAEKSVAIEPKAGWTRARLLWLYLHLGDLDAARDVQRGFDAADSNGRLNAALICYRTGDLEGADRITRRSIKDPDIDSGFALELSIEAVVELALAHQRPASARDFILSVPTLKKEHGRLAIVGDNVTYFLPLAAVEQQAGNASEAARLAQETLNFVERGELHEPPGLDDWTRASALALLGRNDEAMQALEHMAQRGNRYRWWVTLQSDPSFATLRRTPRFQAFASQTQEWFAAQQSLVQGMRQRGELISRSAAGPVDGC